MKTNLSYLKNMSGGSFDIIKEMIDIFIEQVKELAVDMENALESNDYMALSKLAHKAKSSVSIMGMEHQALELKLLEALAHEAKETEKYPQMVASFISDCAIAVKELELVTPESI